MEMSGFIAPLDVAEFRARYFGQRPLHIPAVAHRQEVLSWQRFNDVLALSPHWHEESLKVYYKGRAALRENYCDTADLATGVKAPVNPAKVRSLLGLGASLVANHVHKVCPELALIVTTLEREFAARSFANVYCSFQGVQAFQTHFDLHDVFALQVAGEKTWRVYEARADAPVTTLPPGDEIEKWLTASRGKLLFDVNMKPGDLLYLPRGQYHDALTGAQASLHVTFGVAPATGLALFKLLETVLASESAFRQHLPDARAADDLRGHLADLADRVRAVMTAPAFALEVQNLQRSQAQAAADYRLPSQVPPSWFSVAKPAQVVRRDSGYAVVFQGGTIPIGVSYPTVEWMLQQRLFSLEDATARHSGVDHDALRLDLDKLIAAGILVATEMH
jgi:bifunctional lysine-specific demethylase and histidyl-hydroxylase NO66